MSSRWKLEAPVGPRRAAPSRCSRGAAVSSTVRAPATRHSQRAVAHGAAGSHRSKRVAAGHPPSNTEQGVQADIAGCGNEFDGPAARLSVGVAGGHRQRARNRQSAAMSQGTVQHQGGVLADPRSVRDLDARPSRHARRGTDDRRRGDVATARRVQAQAAVPISSNSLGQSAQWISHCPASGLSAVRRRGGGRATPGANR